MNAVSGADLAAVIAAENRKAPKRPHAWPWALGLIIIIPIAAVIALASLYEELLPWQSRQPPSTYALEKIPPNMLTLYQSPIVQQECPTLSWSIVAAIIHLESNDGQNPAVSSQGAMGPSQFLPTTWDSQGRTVVQFKDAKGNLVPFGRDPNGQGYALDGNGDGIGDINNPNDSVPATARLLCANGAGNPATLASAIYAYNHAWWYVYGGLDDNGHKFIGVLPLAKKLVAAYSSTAPSVLTAPGGLAAGSSPQGLAAAILANPNIITDGRLVNYDLSQQAAGALPSAGTPLHPDLLAIINYIGQAFQIHISALESGGTGHGSSSTHYAGWAVDISVINGIPTTGRDANALSLLNYIMPSLPFGSGIGQSGCGPAVQLTGDVIEFPDSCDHLHLQVP